ncbi:unnamed protein product [Calypogeia fissa]
MDQSLNFSVSKDEKLNGNNYPIWSYKMEQNYVKDRVWYVVRENVCGAAVDPNDPVNPTPAERRADQSKALYMLTKAVDDQILARYTNIRDPAILWAELKRACAGNIVTRRSVLKRKLFSLRFPESATMSQNFSSINELLNQLAAVGVSFTNEELNGFVIDALPSLWEIFGSVIAGRETTPTFIQLENLIREEEIRRSSRLFAGEEALFARSVGHFPNRGRSNAGGCSCSYNSNNTCSNPGQGRGFGQSCGAGQQSSKPCGFCHIYSDPSHWANTCPFKGLKSELDSAIARMSQLKVGAPTVNVAKSVPVFEESYIADLNDSQVTADQVLEANLSELASSSNNNPGFLILEPTPISLVSQLAYLILYLSLLVP